MKKTLLFVLLGAAAGVAGYQIYKKHAEQAEDIYAQEASEHQFETYITKPMKADDAEPETVGEEPIEEAEATADAETANEPKEAPAVEPVVSEEPTAETVEEDPAAKPAADTAAGEERSKKGRKAEPKKD